MTEFYPVPARTRNDSFRRRPLNLSPPGQDSGRKEFAEQTDPRLPGKPAPVTTETADADRRNREMAAAFHYTSKSALPGRNNTPLVFAGF